MKVSRWYEFILDDSNYLSGCSVASFLRKVVDFSGYKNILLDDLIGARTEMLEQKACMKVSSFDEVMVLIEEVIQFDWCNFLIFKGDGFSPNKQMSYPELISNSDVVVRAVDDQYLYLYTKNKALIEYLKQSYEKKSKIEINYGYLEDFTYPE